MHFEIGGPDDAPLVAFYGELFGWKLQSFEGGGYTLIDTNGGGGINGGIGKSQTGEPWSTFYVEADDLQAVLDKAESLGGRRSCRSPTSAARSPSPCSTTWTARWSGW